MSMDYERTVQTSKKSTDTAARLLGMLGRITKQR